MARHYFARDFFRQMPNRLLARYFRERGLFAEFDFAAMKETKIDSLFEAWMALPDGERNRMDAEFREIEALSCEQGFHAIRDEARWRLRESEEAYAAFVEEMAGLDGHFERAMVTFLDHQEYWKGATLFCHADSLSYWRKRKGLPHVAASVHAEGRNELAAEISRYFRGVEGRGKNCVVEALRRGDLDYFFAYPEDYSQQSLEWIDEKFDRRQHKPAFEVVYVYSQRDGTLDVNCRESSKAVEPLQAMFAKAILKLPGLPPDPEDTRVYNLNQLAARGFQFVYEPASGIQRVAVKKLRFASKVVRGDRVTVEADANANPEAIYDLVEKVGKSIPLKLYNVSQVEIAAKVCVGEDARPKSVSFQITYPNSCSLKYDETDLKLRNMLVDSGIEPREPMQDESGPDERPFEE